MPIFKPKNTKKIVVSNNSIVTLDSKHSELIKQFDDELTINVPNLKKEKREILEILKNEDLSLDVRLDYEDKIKIINEQIRDIKQKKKKYYLDNSKYIFDYFENKKLVEDGKNKVKKLDSFFNIKKNDDILDINNDNINNSVQKYLYNIDEVFFDINKFVTQKDVCQYCNKGELIPIEHEGILVCKNCGKNIRYLVENEKPSYKEPPKEVCFYAYKRINHFREILAQFQAKETTQIHDDVLQDIENQIKKERISLNEITTKKAKEILKKLGYNKYYEHIPFIKDKLGIKPPIMPPQLEEKLCDLFMDIQGPYAKYCPDDRVNFLNYYYTVYKLCELLNQDEFLPYFPLLKDKEKMIEQDEIWRKICEELDWEFIPTV